MMNENSFCICCYNNNTSFVNKCRFDDHKICTKCHKEYALKFNKIGCMFCNPFEQKNYNKLPTRNIHLILCANVIICILIIIVLYMLIQFILSIMLFVKDKCIQLI
jgi:uncharacterized membrane protein YvbJ